MIWCFLYGHRAYRIGPIGQYRDVTHTLDESWQENWYEVCFSCGKTLRKWST